MGPEPDKEADGGRIVQSGTPLASIVVPLLEGARFLEGTLAAMRAQELDGELEILVVDGGSRDGSRAIVERAARADDRIRLLDNPARLTPYALNIGLGAARGVYVARMDAHTQFARDYVALGVERLQHGDVACASGPQLAVGEGPTSRAVAVALQSRLGVGGAGFRRAGCEEVEVDSSFCGVWRRDLLLGLGGWDEDWPVNQDAELAARIRARGGRIVCLPQMAAHYAPRAGLPGLARQYWRYGQYRAKTAGRHPDALRRSHVLAPGLVAVGASGAVPLQITRPARWALALYGAVVAAEGLRASRRAGTAGLAPGVPAALAVMHAAWGAGFLEGCWRFGVPWRALAGLVRRPPPRPARLPAPTAPAASGSELRIGYIVSRFPALSETFVLRELAEVDARTGVSCKLFSLFPDGGGPVHPSARAWVARRSCATPLGSARAAAYWAARRPLRLAGAIALVVHDYRRHPRLLGRALVTVACALEHARRLRIEPVDHLHAHFATYPSLAAWICSRLVGVPYSFTAHAHDLFIHRLGLRRRIEDAAFCVGISEHNARILRAVAPGRSADVHVVHCAVRPASLPVRLRAPRPGAPMRVACVAALRTYKGHHVLVDAIARLAHAGEAVELDLVGDGPLRGQLERQCARLGVATRVHFLGGLTEPAVAEVLDRAHAFAQASVVQPDGDTDGIPVALMEAMAAGVPVVASRVSGVPELVRDGETGLLAPPGDSAALADALRSLRAEPGAAIERARAARALVEEQFAVEGQSSRLLALIRASSSSPRPAAAASGPG
jgi:glycosyltransferase involved in cell wall biosynthesis/GT2 family glycosyltransferase